MFKKFRGIWYTQCKQFLPVADEPDGGSGIQVMYYALNEHASPSQWPLAFLEKSNGGAQSRLSWDWKPTESCSRLNWRTLAICLLMWRRPYGHTIPETPRLSSLSSKWARWTSLAVCIERVWRTKVICDRILYNLCSCKCSLAAENSARGLALNRIQPM